MYCMLMPAADPMTEEAFEIQVHVWYNLTLVTHLPVTGF